MEVKNKYECELAHTKELHLNNKNIVEIEEKVKNLFEENNWMDTESNLDDDFVENERISKSTVEKEVEVHPSYEVEKQHLPPDNDGHLDIIAWLKSPEGMLEIQKDYEDLYAPSFSLGISQICQEVMEEHGGDAEKNQGEDNMTPLHQKKRVKRAIKVGPAYRSPYIQRNINVNSNYTKEEIAVYRWLIQPEKDMM